MGSAQLVTKSEQHMRRLFVRIALPPSMVAVGAAEARVLLIEIGTEN